MKLVIISDTHGFHDYVKLPEGDVLIHCGDCTFRHDDERYVQEFAAWFEKQDFKHKICIAGNHDKYMSSKWFKDAIYLQDSGAEIDGVKFWGSPWTPASFDWYWMKNRGPDIREAWDRIPDDTDVLITHGPPDCAGGGCEDLTEAVKRVNPKIHCFGHIHKGYMSEPMLVDGFDTKFINAAQALMNSVPVVIDV